MANPSPSRFPVLAGVLIGLGLGGFFDGIVFHQLLQWHHMLSSWYPVESIRNFRLNTVADGLFHSATYALVVVGLFLLWRRGEAPHALWSGGRFAGTILFGWGLFNLVEGVVDHEILGVHHVNETVPVGERVAWDAGFLVWGALFAVAGLALMRRRASVEQPA